MTRKLDKNVFCNFNPLPLKVGIQKWKKYKVFQNDRNGIVGSTTHRYRTSQEDDLKGRQPYKKRTLKKTGRRPYTKKPSHEFNLTGR